MKLFHLLAGIGLIGLTGYSAFLPFIEDDSAEDRFKVVIMLVGLALGFVLFTGFLQLGSRHSVPQVLIYKLAATALGGAVVLLGLLLRLKRIVVDPVFVGVMAVGFLLFGSSFYWGLMI